MSDKNKKIVECPKKHKLEFIETGYQSGGYRCDICFKVFNETKSWNCKECQYDLCKQCYQNKLNPITNKPKQQIASNGLNNNAAMLGGLMGLLGQLGTLAANAQKNNQNAPKKDDEIGRMYLFIF